MAAKSKAPASLLDQLDAKITAWHAAKAEADKAVQLEKNLRIELFSMGFPNPEPGTNKMRINHGMALIGDHRINYTIDKPILEFALQEPEMRPLIETIIAYRPEVRDGAFRKLSDNERKIVAGFITEKPGLPGIELKPANRVRW